MEFVWVVRRRDLFPSFTPHGFVPLGVEELEDRYLSVVRERGFFVERREAEVTPAWKCNCNGSPPFGNGPTAHWQRAPS